MKKILVVDDSETMRRHVGEALGGAGFNILEASDAQEALASLKRDEEIAVLILDINMPGMNGLDMLERLRSESPRAQPPTLMLTTEADPALIERAKRLGASGWMIKPVNTSHLINACQKIAR